MIAFNVVRFKVKPGFEQEFVELWEGRVDQHMTVLEKRERFLERKERILAGHKGPGRDRLVDLLGEAELAFFALVFWFMWIPMILARQKPLHGDRGQGKAGPSERMIGRRRRHEGHRPGSTDRVEVCAHDCRRALQKRIRTGPRAGRRQHPVLRAESGKIAEGQEQRTGDLLWAWPARVDRPATPWPCVVIEIPLFSKDI